MCILLSLAPSPALSARVEASLADAADLADAAEGPSGPSQLALTLWKVALQRNGAVHQVGKTAMKVLGINNKQKIKLHVNTARENMFVHNGLTDFQKERVRRYSAEHYGVENMGKSREHCEDDRVPIAEGDRDISGACWWEYFMFTGGGKGGVVLNSRDLEDALDRRLWRKVSLENWAAIELDSRVVRGLADMKDMKDCDTGFDPKKDRAPKEYYNGEGYGLKTQGFCDNMYSFKVTCEDYKVPVGHGLLIRGDKGFTEVHEIWASCAAGGADEKCKIDKTDFCKTDSSYYGVEPDKTGWEDQEPPKLTGGLVWTSMKLDPAHTAARWTLDDCEDVYGTDEQGRPKRFRSRLDRKTCPQTFSLSRARRLVDDCGSKAAVDCQKFHVQIGEGTMGDKDDPGDEDDDLAFLAPCVPDEETGTCVASQCSCTELGGGGPG